MEKYLDYLRSVGDLDFKKHTRKDRAFMMFDNNLMDCLLLSKLNGSELRLMLWFIKRTHGEINWNKKRPLDVDISSQRAIAQELNMGQSALNKALKKLAVKKMISVKNNVVTINMEFTEWGEPAVAAFIESWMKKDSARIQDAKMKKQKRLEKQARQRALSRGELVSALPNKMASYSKEEQDEDERLLKELAEM